MYAWMKKISLSAAMVAAAVTLSATLAQAQDIYPVEGGRTTVTLTKSFIDTLANLNIVPTAVVTSQLYDGVIMWARPGTPRGRIAWSSSQGHQR